MCISCADTGRVSNWTEIWVYIVGLTTSSLLGKASVHEDLTLSGDLTFLFQPLLP